MKNVGTYCVILKREFEAMKTDRNKYRDKSYDLQRKASSKGREASNHLDKIKTLKEEIKELKEAFAKKEKAFAKREEAFANREEAFANRKEAFANRENESKESEIENKDRQFKKSKSATSFSASAFDALRNNKNYGVGDDDDEVIIVSPDNKMKSPDERYQSRSSPGRRYSNVSMSSGMSGYKRQREESSSDDCVALPNTPLVFNILKSKNANTVIKTGYNGLGTHINFVQRKREVTDEKKSKVLNKKKITSMSGHQKRLTGFLMNVK